MNKEIENLIKKIALRDLEIKLLEAQAQGDIIPDNVYLIIKELEKTYD